MLVQTGSSLLHRLDLLICTDSGQLEVVVGLLSLLAAHLRYRHPVGEGQGDHCQCC